MAKAVMSNDGVVSRNLRRNSCQRVYHNTDQNGRTTTMTCHEPFLKHERMKFANHKYMDYEKKTPSLVPSAEELAQAA